jgi:SAM-dependent methyltransferase
MDPVLARELDYHERLYSGFAQRHFARPAVRALRAHMVRRILRATGAGSGARVLSLGCGIADTELLMAPYVGEIVGVDLSPAAVRQARQDAARAGLRNVGFLEGAPESLELDGGFDLVMCIFFLHHLPDEALAQIPGHSHRLLAPGGKFYSLDPSRYRLSGAIGSLVAPRLMRKYQSPGERELAPRQTARLFHDAGFACRWRIYDFTSTPLAGLCPGWRAGYQAARLADDLLVRLPLIRRAGSNFEIIATKPR